MMGGWVMLRWVWWWGREGRENRCIDWLLVFRMVRSRPDEVRVHLRVQSLSFLYAGGKGSRAHAYQVSDTGPSAQTSSRPAQSLRAGGRHTPVPTQTSGEGGSQETSRNAEKSSENGTADTARELGAAERSGRPVTEATTAGDVQAASSASEGLAPITVKAASLPSATVAGGCAPRQMGDDGLSPSAREEDKAPHSLNLHGQEGRESSPLSHHGQHMNTENTLTVGSHRNKDSHPMGSAASLSSCVDGTAAGASGGRLAPVSGSEAREGGAAVSLSRADTPDHFVSVHFTAASQSMAPGQAADRELQ